jgi:hypothetical protein
MLGAACCPWHHVQSARYYVAGCPATACSCSTCRLQHIKVRACALHLHWELLCWWDNHLVQACRQMMPSTREIGLGCHEQEALVKSKQQQLDGIAVEHTMRCVVLAALPDSHREQKASSKGIQLPVRQPHVLQRIQTPHKQHALGSISDPPVSCHPPCHCARPIQGVRITFHVHEHLWWRFLGIAACSGLTEPPHHADVTLHVKGLGHPNKQRCRVPSCCSIRHALGHQQRHGSVEGWTMGLVAGIRSVCGVCRSAVLEVDLPDASKGG